MGYSDIIDNKTTPLSEYISNFLEESESAKFAVGYLYLSGLLPLVDTFSKIKELKILAGSISRNTYEELADIYPSDEELKETVSLLEFQRPSEKKAIIEDISRKIQENISALPHSLKKEKAIIKLREMIVSGKIKIKIYTKERFHAKAYLFKYKKDYVKGTGSEGIAIVGSSNLTLSGFRSNTELNVILRSQNQYNELDKWFDRLWNARNSEALNSITSEILNNSWAIKTVSPYDIYVYTLYHLVKDNLYRQASVIWNWDNMPPLYFFQKVAVMQAYNTLQRYNGVFISDVVGLGKTFIGAALLRQFGKRALVISPAGLVDMWEEFLEKFGIDGRVISEGLLGRNEVEKSVLQKYENRELVLIDESHHFRNPKSKRYRELKPFLHNKKVILITATPLNISPWNIYNQIMLFREDEENVFTEGGSIREYFKKIEDGEKRLPDILRPILIRRTRKHIVEFYKGIEKELALTFPERKLFTVTYNINETYNKLYYEIKELLQNLTYAKYNLWKYVKPDKKAEKPYSDLKKVAGTLKGFHRVLLYKRLESSVYAFRMSIKNIRGRYSKFLKVMAETGQVPAGEKIQDLIERYEVDEVLRLNEIMDVLKEYKIEDFDVEGLKLDMEKDINIFDEILEFMRQIGDEEDTKYYALLDEVIRIWRKDSSEKILIFSEYRDTVKYLHRRIEQDFPDRKDIEFVTSNKNDTANLGKSIGRFAPIANNYPCNDGITLLVGTDVLSEGHNLQDCRVVINYDLHWNPVKLIQRVGRVDRIGSDAKEIIAINFLPTERTEKEIGIRETLRKRIEEIHNDIGEDAKILEENERLNKDALYAIYLKKDMEEIEKDTEMFSFEEAENIIRKLQQENPAYFSLIKKMPPGLHSTKKSSEKGIYSFFTDNVRPYLIFMNEDRKIIEDFDRVIKLITCTPEEKESRVVSKKGKELYYASLSEMEKNLRGKIKSSPEEKIHPVVRRAKERLKKLIGELSSEEVKENVNKLDKILNKFFPYNLVKDFRMILNVKDSNKFLNDIISFYNEHKLWDIEKKSPLEQRYKTTLKFLCGEMLK